MYYNNLYSTYVKSVKIIYTFLMSSFKYSKLQNIIVYVLHQILQDINALSENEEWILRFPVFFFYFTLLHSVLKIIFLLIFLTKNSENFTSWNSDRVFLQVFSKCEYIVKGFSYSQDSDLSSDIKSVIKLRV